MANAMTYIANLGKSVTYSTVDRLKEMNPALSDLADQNAELGKILYESVKDFKGTTKRAKKYVSESAVGEFAKEYKKAFFEDIKTGKFYNRERDDIINTRAAGSLLDDDDPFADLDAMLNDKSSSSPDWSDLSEDDRQTTKMMDTVGNKVTNGVAMATARSAEFQVEAYRDGLNKQQKHAEFLTNKINTGIAGMNSTIAKLIEFNDKAMSVHIENSKNYYTKMTELTTENNKLLKQLVQYQANIYNTKEEKKGSSSNSRFSDIAAGGMPSLKAYTKNVFNNLNAATGGILDMNSMLGEGSNILLTAASSPLKFIPEMLAKKIIPSAIENSVKSLNETLSGLFAGTMLKINEARDDFDTPDALQKLYEIFGINIGVKSKSSINTGKYNKGPMPWDGEAKMALTRVIPDYLAKILAATTGASEKFFDYETGKYRDISILNEEMDNLDRKYSDQAASEILEYMRGEINKINFAGQKENYDILMEDMHRLFENAYSQGKIIGFNKKDAEKINYSDMGITEESAKILIPLLQNIVDEDGLNKRSMMMAYNRKILENRDAQNRYMKGLEDSSTSLMRNLNNNIGFDEYISTIKLDQNDKKHLITDVRDLTDRQLRTNKNPNLINNIYLVKDEYNKNVFWYLQRFAQEFATIRTNGVSVNNLNYEHSSENTPTDNIEPRHTTASLNNSNELLGINTVIGGVGFTSLRSKRFKNNIRDEESFDRYQNKHAEELKKKYDQAPAGYMLANDEFYSEELKDSMKKYSAYLKTDADFRRFQQLSKDNKEREKKYKNSLIGSIMEADSVDERFKNIIMGVDELSHKPAEFLSGIIGKVDKRLFNIVYGDEDDDKLSPKSFMGNLISRLTSTFANFGDFFKDEIINPLKDTLFGDKQEDSLKNKIKEMFKDENVKEFLKNAFGDKVDFVKDAFSEKYQSFLDTLKGKEDEADKINYANEIMKQAASENAIRNATNEIGGLPPGTTFKLDENGMPIKNSKGGYETIVDAKQLARKANRINDFTNKKYNNLKVKQSTVANDVFSNYKTNGLGDSIVSTRDEMEDIEDQIAMYENSIPFASEEEAKVYEEEIKKLRKRYTKLKKEKSARKLARSASLDEMDARGVKNGRKFGMYFQESKDAEKEREEGREEYEAESNRLDAKKSQVEYIINETESGISSRERKAILSSIRKNKNKIAEIDKELSNPNIDEAARNNIKNSIKDLKKEVKYLNKKIASKDISEEEAIALSTRLSEVTKQINEKSALLINPDLDEDKINELNNSKSSLQQSISDAKSRLKSSSKIILTNDERSSLQNRVGELDTYIRHNKASLRNGNLSPDNRKILEDTIKELEAEKEKHSSRLTNASPYTVEDRNNALAERRSLKNQREVLDNKYWGKQNSANFNALEEMFELGMSGQDIEDKGYGRYVFRSDRFKNNLNSRLDYFSGLMNDSRDADGNVTDTEASAQYDRYNKIQKWLNNLSNLNDTGLFRKGKSNFAYGGEITKTGIAAVSEGELIIPSEYNPYYKGSNNKLSQLAKEEQAKKNFTGFLNSLKNLKVDKANQFATAGTADQNVDDGIANIDNVVPINVNRETKTPASDEEVAPHSYKKFSHERTAEMADLINNGVSVDEIAKKYGCTPDDVIHAVQNSTIGAGIGNAGKSLIDSLKYLFKRSGIKEGIDEVTEAVSGKVSEELDITDEDKEKLYLSMVEDVKEGKDKYIPAMIGGGVVGAGVSLLTGAIGGPLLGAAVGAGTNLLTKSGKVQEWLFGEYDENHERKGNILSKDLANNIEKYLPGMAKSATVGGIMGILPFTPGGPVSGIILGSALAFAKKNEKIQKFIFGDDEDPDSGLLSKNTIEFLKAHVPEAVIGAVGGAFFMPGPFGIVGKMMLGGALGFVSQTDKFQDALFGKVNEETGEREGGLIGVLRDGFVRPLVDFGKEFGTKARDWIKEDIIDPITGAIKPLFKQGADIGRSIFNWVGEGIGNIVAPKLGGGAKFLGQRLAHKTKNVLGVAGKVASTLTTPTANIISSPFRAVGAIGDHFRRKQIQNGEATYMSAEERNTYRDEMRDNVIYDKYTSDEYGKNEKGEQVLLHRKGEIKKDEFGQRIIKKHLKPKLFSRTLNGRGLNHNHGLGRILHPLENPDKFEQFDRDLVDMSKEDLESMRGTLDILSSKDKTKNAREKAIDNVNDLFANQFASKLGWENTNKIRKILSKGNGSPESFNKINKIINNANMSDTDRAALKNNFLQKFSEYKTLDDIANGKNDAKNKMYEKLRNLGLTDISDKTLYKYKDMVNQEYKIKNKMGIEGLNENQEKRHKEIIDVLREGIEVLEHLNDPDYVNEKKLQNYIKNSQSASRKQGLFGFGFTSGSDVVNAKDVSIDEDGNYVYTDEDGNKHIMTPSGRDAETGEILSNPGNNFTLAARGARRAKDIIKSPFRNFWTNTGVSMKDILRDNKLARRYDKLGTEYSHKMSIDEIEDFLGDDIKDIIDTEEYSNLSDDEKKAALKELLGKKKAENNTTYGFGKRYLNRKHRKTLKKVNELYGMDNDALSEFLQRNNIGDGTEDLDDDEVRSSLIDRYQSERYAEDEEDTRTVADFMGNPIQWVKNAKGQWVQKISSSNKLTDKLQYSIFKPIDAISNKISDLTADMKDIFTRFFHLDEEDGWGKKLLKIGGGILGALTVAGFMPILENYWGTRVAPGLKNFWDNTIYPKIETYVAPIKPAIAKAAIGVDAAIRSIPSAIENLGNRIYGFLTVDLPNIWATKIIPFYQGGIDWVANKAERIATEATTLLLKVAPSVLKGVFNGVRKWWTTDLSNIILHRNGNTKAMGSDDFGENVLKDNLVKDDSSNSEGIFQRLYSSVFGESAHQTLSNSTLSANGVDSATKNYYMGDDITDYPYDDVRFSAAGTATTANTASSKSPTMGSKKNSATETSNSSFSSYSESVVNSYNSANYSNDGYIDAKNNKNKKNKASKDSKVESAVNQAYMVTPNPGVNTDNIPFVQDNYSSAKPSRLETIKKSVEDSYNKAVNKTEYNTTDRNGNSNIHENTPGYIETKGKINYFDYGFVTDTGYILNKDSIIVNKKNCLVYDKESGNIIPNIFYDPDSKKFTNIPTNAAKATYNKSIESLSSTERYNLPDTLEEMHDEELISNYSGAPSLYENSILLSQTNKKGENIKVSDHEADRDINDTNAPNNSIGARYLSKGLRNTVLHTDRAIEMGTKLSKFGGKLAKASALGLAKGKITKSVALVNGLGIKSLGLAMKGPAMAVNAIKNPIKNHMSNFASGMLAKDAAKASANATTDAFAEKLSRTASESLLERGGEDTARNAGKSDNFLMKFLTDKGIIRERAEREAATGAVGEKIKKKILNSVVAKKSFKELMEQAGNKFTERAYTQFASSVSDSIGKAIAKGVKRGSAKAAARGLAAVGTAGIATILFGIGDFASGCAHAPDNFNLTKDVFESLDFWKQLALRFISGLTTMLLGIGIVTSLIPPELVIGAISGPLFKLLSIDEDTIEKMRKASEDEIVKHNKEYGTNYSTNDVRDYNNRNSLWTKFKKGVGNAVNGVKNFFGIGKKSEEEKKAEESRSKIDDAVKATLADNSETTTNTSTPYDAYKNNSALFNSYKRMESSNNTSAKGSGLTPTMDKLFTYNGKGSEARDISEDTVTPVNRNSINRVVKPSKPRFSYSNMIKTNKAIEANKLELPKSSSLFMMESAKGSGIQDSNIIDLTDGDIAYSGINRKRANYKVDYSAKGSNEYTDINNNLYDNISLQTANTKPSYASNTSYVYDDPFEYTGGASNRKKKIGNVKITKDNMYIDGVTDTERSEYIIDDLIYCISVIESSASFAGCSWKSTSQGSIGVGIFQWRGTDCKKLLYDIAKAEGTEAEKLLGKELYNSIIAKKNIKGKNLTNDEKNKIAKLLITDTGKSIQLERAHKDAVTIVNRAKKAWSNPKVILYWGLIYAYAPLVAKDLINDNALSKKVSINHFFNVFSNNYDLYKDNEDKWSKAYNLAMASPVWKVTTDKWNKDFIKSKMSADYNELQSDNSNPISRLFGALKKMGEAWFGLGTKETVEANNIDTGVYDNIDSNKTDQLDPYTSATLSEYAKEADNEKHYLKTRLKYVRQMIDIDEDVAISLIDNNCKSLLKLLKYSSEGKKYLNTKTIKNKANILKNTKLATSIIKQLSVRLNDPDLLCDTTDIALDPKKRVKCYNTFVYYYIAIGNQQDAKKLQYKNTKSCVGVFNVEFAKNILINSENFIKAISACKNRLEAIEFLRNYKDSFLTDVDNGEYISSTDVMLIDLDNAFGVLGDKNNSLSAKEKSWNVAEAILSSMDDSARKMMINNLGKQYNVTDFDFMLDSTNKGNEDYIKSIYAVSPYRGSKKVISLTQWTKKTGSTDYNSYVNEMKKVMNGPSSILPAKIDTMYGSYKDTRYYHPTNASNPYSFQKNLQKGNLEAIDKIYEHGATNYNNGKHISFNELARALYHSNTGSITNTDEDEIDAAARADALISDDCSKGELHDAFKQYYSLWKKVPENVGGPFINDNDVNWNELMHARARYDIYNSLNSDASTDNDVSLVSLNAAKSEYERQNNIAEEILGGPINNPDNKTKSESLVNDYLSKHYASTTDKNASYFSSHKDYFTTDRTKTYGLTGYNDRDGYDPSEIGWLTEKNKITSIINNQAIAAAMLRGYNGMPSDVVNKIYNQNPYVEYYKQKNQTTNTAPVERGYNGMPSELSHAMNLYETTYNSPGYATPSDMVTITKLTNGTASSKDYNKYKDWCKANNIDIKTKNKDSSAKGSGFISQLDYANAKFNDGESVAEAGCGPAVAAMAIQNLRNDSAKGTDLMSATTALANRYKNGGGTQASYFKDVMSRVGANTSYTNSSSEIKSNLKKGEQVVLMGRDASNKSKANSPFGPNNHYVLATGMGNGKITVNDPEQHGPSVYSDKILKNTKLGVSISGKGSGMKMNVDISKFSARGSYSSGKTTTKVSHEGIAPNAKKYRKTLEEACKHHGVSVEWVDFLLSMMTRESHGNGSDPMQAAEGVGNSKQGTKSGKTYSRRPNGITNPVDSCYAGVYELKDRLNSTGYNNPYNAQEILDLAQGYNYGGGYITWLKNRGEHYTIKNAIEFGKQHSSGYSAGYGTPNHALKVWDTYKTTKSGKKAASGKYSDYIATATSGSSSTKGNSKDKSSWMDRLVNSINKTMNSFLGLNSGSDDGDSGDMSNVGASSSEVINKTSASDRWKLVTGGKCSTSAEARKLSKEECEKLITTITVTVRDANGKKSSKKIRCNKYIANMWKEFFNDIYNNTSLRIKELACYTYRKKVGGSYLSSHSYGTAVDINWSTPSMGYKQSPLSLSAWKKSKYKDYAIGYGSPAANIIAKYKLDWGGSWASAKDPMHISYVGDADTSTVISRINSGSYSGKGSGLNLLSAKGSDLNDQSINNITEYDDKADSFTANSAKGSDIINDTPIYNYLKGNYTKDKYTNSNRKGMYTETKYDKPVSTKVYKSIDRHIKDNGIKLANESVSNASNKAGIMSDIIKNSAKGSSKSAIKSTAAHMPASSDQVIAKSVAYIKNHKISASRKPEDDIKVLLHAILSLEAVTANNSYDINTIVKLLTKLVNDKSVESKSTKKHSAKGSDLDTAAVKQSVKDKTPSKEQATTIINTVNTNNSNNTGDHGLSDLINSLQYIVSK